MIRAIESLNNLIWGIPLMLLIVAVGLYLTVKSCFLQLRLLPRALRRFLQNIWDDQSGSGMSSYRSLCTALAATVGTGNLAGVAGAIAIGGPGAVFWMWISGFLGMIIKFTEVVCAMYYRKKMPNGEWNGGPMVNIQAGMPPKFHFLAYVFAFFGVVASFGVGNAAQINTILGGIESIAQTAGKDISFANKIIFGVILAALIFLMFRKGVEGVGKCTQILVPVAAGTYILFSIGVLICKVKQIPPVFQMIFCGALNPESVTGGIIGSAFLALRTGVSRGIFTNEAGMGTASIAHACTAANDPMEQGLMGLVEVFLDTIVICTLTALVILCCDVPIPYGSDPGIRLTIEAFSSVYTKWIQVPLTLIVCLLAVATILGWGVYGARCMQFIFGQSSWKWYILLQSIAVVLGTVVNTATVWTLSEITNGLMALPNLISLGYFAPKLIMKIKTYRPV